MPRGTRLSVVRQRVEARMRRAQVRVARCKPVVVQREAQRAQRGAQRVAHRRRRGDEKGSWRYFIALRCVGRGARGAGSVRSLLAWRAVDKSRLEFKDDLRVLREELKADLKELKAELKADLKR